MEDLIKLVDSITVKPYVTTTKTMSGLYPTSASVQYVKNNETITVGQCLRNLWYKFQNYPFTSENTAESIDKMNIGEWFSDNLIERFKQLGLYVADEVPFTDPTTGVRGRIDIIIKDPNKAPKAPNRPLPSQLIGIEVKSTGGYHNIKGPVISTRDTPLMPKIEHVMQVMLYLNYYKEYNLDTWVIIYYDRESLRKQWHKVTLDTNGSPVITNAQQSITLSDITIKGINERFNALKLHVSNNTIPNRDYQLQYSNSYLKKLADQGELNETETKSVLKKVEKYKGSNINEIQPLIIKGDSECGYCSFKELCWSENPTRRAPVTVPVKVEKETPEEISFI